MFSCLFNPSGIVTERMQMFFHQKNTNMGSKAIKWYPHLIASGLEAILYAKQIEKQVNIPTFTCNWREFQCSCKIYKNTSKRQVNGPTFTFFLHWFIQKEASSDFPSKFNSSLRVF